MSDQCANRQSLLSTGQRLTPLWALKAIYFVSIGANACLFRFIAVFYHQIGFDNAQIGFLQLCNPWVTFAGSLGWAAVCDHVGEYKRVLIFSNLVGGVFICCLLVPAVQAHFLTVLACVLVGAAFLASRAGVTDALTLAVVREYEQFKLERGLGADEAPCQPSYGEQRLWGAAGYGTFALLSGVLTDILGDGAMFAGFGACLAVTITIITTQLPSSSGRKAAASAANGGGSFVTFDLVWFFANLLVYGAHMALVETYLFVYLLRDFQNTSRKLLGCSVAVMCTFELPVFFYIRRLIDRVPLTLLLSACHAVFALRTFAYSMLPYDYPWMVLLVEPLHGITMAAMWSCSVEFGRRLAPAGAEAKMQAVVAGAYYRVACGAGNFAWGFFTKPPPAGYGFVAAYRLATATILAWSLLWNLGWWAHSHRKRGAGATVAAPHG